MNITSDWIILFCPDLQMCIIFLADICVSYEDQKTWMRFEHMSSHCNSETPSIGEYICFNAEIGFALVAFCLLRKKLSANNYSAYLLLHSAYATIEYLVCSCQLILRKVENIRLLLNTSKKAILVWILVFKVGRWYSNQSQSYDVNQTPNTFFADMHKYTWG